MNSGVTPQALYGQQNVTDGLGNIILHQKDLDLPTNCSQDQEIHALDPQHGPMYCEPIDSIPLVILSGLLATATIAGNLLVILAILRGSSRFHRPMYWLIIHLSVADLLVGIMLLWNYCLAFIFNIHNTISSLMVVFCIWVTSESASTLGFLLLAVDRYIQIFYKTFHRTYVTRVTVGIAIFLAWAVPFSVFTVPPMVFGHSCGDECVCAAEKYMHCLPRTECSQIIPPFQKSYTLAVALMLLLCIPIPIVIYTMIFVKVRRRTIIAKTSHKRHDMRLIKTLVVILAVFVFSLSPVAVLVIIDYIIYWENDTMIDVAFYIFVLAFLNSLANPLLYMWRMSAIRRSIRQRVIFCFWKKNTNNTSSRRDITSFQSDQRSPTSNRHDIKDMLNHANNQKRAQNNNNVPLAAMLCLRQIKKGRYNNSRTSTPLSERTNHNHNQNHEETQRFTNGIEGEMIPNVPDDISIHKSCCEKFECEITEL